MWKHYREWCSTSTSLFHPKISHQWHQQQHLHVVQSTLYDVNTWRKCNMYRLVSRQSCVRLNVGDKQTVCQKICAKSFSACVVRALSAAPFLPRSQKMQRPKETTSLFSSAKEVSDELLSSLANKVNDRSCLLLIWLRCCVESSGNRFIMHMTFKHGIHVHAWHTIKWWQRLMFKRLKKQMRLKFILHTRLLPCTRKLASNKFGREL